MGQPSEEPQKSIDKHNIYINKDINLPSMNQPSGEIQKGKLSMGQPSEEPQKSVDKDYMFLNEI